MTTTSIKQTIELIESAIQTNFTDEVPSVYFDKFTDLEGEKKYPAISYYYADSGSQLALNNNVLSLTFQFLDVISGRNNKNDRRKEVVSDMYDLASRIVQHLRQEEGLLIDPAIPTALFDNRYNNGLGGVELTINITMIKPCVV